MYHIVVNYLSDCKDTPRDIWIGFFHLVYVDKPDDLQVKDNSQLKYDNYNLTLNSGHLIHCSLRKGERIKGRY